MANLLIDIGNTALKASWADGMTLGKTFRYQGEKKIAFILSLTEKEKPEIMVVSNVRSFSDKEVERLKAECGRLIIINDEILKERDIPSYLSPDRAASIIASRYLFKGRSCTIFDFGATMTIDKIDASGTYSGGNVSLGCRTRFKALNRYSKNLPLVDFTEEVPELGDSLKSSLQSGVISGMLFEIEGYLSAGTENITVFTGGDANYFAKRMKNCIFAVCNLVLMGLALIAFEYDQKIERIFLLSVFLIISVCASAQSGTYGAYSPYSVFGVGNLSKEGTAFNKSMGGVGIATRNKRFINYLNPAAITARDSLSFMGDIGLSQNNTVFAQNDLRSAHNTFNIYNFVLSFPIYRSSAFMVGITPYSDVGYDFSEVVEDKDIIGVTNNISYDSYGTGSVYQLFAGAGVTFWKRFSVGAELIFLFGNLDKVTNMNYTNSSYRSLNTGNELTVRGVTGKFGLQYEQKLGDNLSMVVGATYRLGSKVRGYASEYRYAVQSSVTDTLNLHVDTLQNTGLRFGDELGIGISIKGGDKWCAEFNYIRSDWSSTGMDSASGFSAKGQSVFTTTVSNSFRAGFEIVPNRNDIRYYLKRCAYRAGVYYDQAYYKLDGNNVNSIGLTLGVTLPVFRWYNGISLGVDVGQRASNRNNMIRENYVTFNIGLNIHDIWFQKPRYN